jgi:AcrR family transcriptional regulator
VAARRRGPGDGRSVSTDQTQSRRAYRSPRRQQQAAETRADVLAAATRLFGDRGWTATGMRDVAREAGVSVETVYANFRTKSDLLMAAIDVAVVGDDEPVPLDRRTVFTALGRGSREQRTRAAARLVTGIHRRTAGVNLALREAAASDPVLDRLMREREEGRRSNVEEGLALVVGHPVSSEQSDALWAVMDIGVYRLLTDLRGWTAHQYESWLAEAIDRLTDGGRRG